MKKVAMIPMVLGVAMGGAAIKLGYDFVQKAEASAGEKVHAVVALVDIDATAEIDPTMVKIIETPMSPLLGPDSFKKIEDVVGRVASTTIPNGAVVRDSLLAVKGTPPGLTVRIPSGFRAVSVKINEVSGVAYQLQPGTNVDVIAVIDIRDPATRHKETFSRIILQQVEVIAIGRTLNADEAGGKAKAAKSVTLLVKDSDVPKLHLAQTRGTVTLAMRSATDTLIADAGGSSESELLGLNDDTTEANPDNQPNTTNNSNGGMPFSLPFKMPSRVAQDTSHSVVVVNGSQPPLKLTFERKGSMKITHSETMAGGRRTARRARGAAPNLRGMKLPDLPTFDFDKVMEDAAGLPNEQELQPPPKPS